MTIPGSTDTPTAAIAGSLKPAGVSLKAALAHTPEPPLTMVCVSWRRIHWPPDTPTRRRMFEYLEDAVEYRAQLERPERTHGEDACSVRIDLIGAWIEARA